MSSFLKKFKKREQTVKNSYKFNDLFNLYGKGSHMISWLQKDALQNKILQCVFLKKQLLR